MPIESLQELRTFVQVVDSKGFTGAAQVLGRTTNTVSRLVARLEARLGVGLLMRTTRKVSATEEGRRLYEHAIALLNSAAAAEEALRRTSRRLDGIVRIAIRTTTLQYGFVGDLVGLLNANPDLRVQLIVADTEIDLAAEGIDVAVRVGDLADSSYRSIPLGSVMFVLAASTDYVARCGAPVSPDDLSRHECVRPLFKRPQTAWRLVGPGGEHADVRVSGRFECGDLRAQAEAIYGGLGIGLRPAGEVSIAAQEGRLVHILPGWSLPPLSVHAILSPQRSRNARVEAVVALLKTAIGRLD